LNPLDLVFALGSTELLIFLWLSVLLDVPRYLLAAIVLGLLDPGAERGARGAVTVSGIIACHNDSPTLAGAIASMQANGVDDIVVVNDSSTDATRAVAEAAGAIVVDLPIRTGKPLAINHGLPYARGEAILIGDADTVFLPGSVAAALAYLEPDIGGVGFRLFVENESATLTSRFQAIEYGVTFAVGRRMADLFGLLSNVSGAAGLFQRAALDEVGGLDCEVAEDAALAMKLRATGWGLRYAHDAHALTTVPETPVGLFSQRLRWDASIITIWWRKYGWMLNPFDRRFTASNLLTSLDVLVFSALLPMIWLPYVSWLAMRAGMEALTLLGAVMAVLIAIDVVVLLLVQTPLRLLPYVPFYAVMQIAVMRPLRVFAMVAELAFSISHRDDYIPESERWRLT
jgi:cellulose synthase/poly-beta-1,6-N-acetylglucosamine synthase-like glycosyltransferase